MKKAFVGLVGTLLLLGFGCGKTVQEKITEKAIEHASGGKADVDVSGDKMKIETAEGTTEWGGTKLPDDWAKDAPVYPGATIQFSGSSNPTSGQPGAVVMLQTPDTGAAVLEYYKKELVAQGWKIEGNFQAGTSATLAASKDTRSLGISIASQGETTAITLGVTTK